VKLNASAITGATAGLLSSITIIGFLYFHMWGVLTIGRTDLSRVLWPSLIMLTGGWRTTAAGIMITVLSVIINCLLYATIAVVIHVSAQVIKRATGRR